MCNNTTLAVIEVVAALALFGVAMVTVATTMQLKEAQADRPIGTGCPAGAHGANASKARCFHG